MLLFHDWEHKCLLRMLLMHYDSIHDLTIKSFQDGCIQYFTCSRDGTLRLWSTAVDTQDSPESMFGSAVDSDLKRIVYLDSEITLSQEED